MAEGVIPKQKKPAFEVTTESVTLTLNWNSTGNPYANGVQDVSKTGWIPVGAGFTVDNSGATNVAPYRFYLSGNNVNYGFRMYNQTPSTVTQNDVQIITTYVRFLEDS